MKYSQSKSTKSPFLLMMTNEKFVTIKYKLLRTIISQQQRRSMMCELKIETPKVRQRGIWGKQKGPGEQGPKA